MCDGGVNVFHSLRFGSPGEDVPPDRECSVCPEAELFISVLEAGVRALGLPVPSVRAPAETVPRDSTAPVRVRPAVTGEKWLCCIDCCRCDVCCWNDSGCDVLCVPKKCCDALLRIVDEAAARPLADKLARVGTTGRLPVIIRAPLNCA